MYSLRVTWERVAENNDINGNKKIENWDIENQKEN